MKHELEVSTTSRTGSYDLTAKVQQVVQESGVTEGLCVVYVPHTTAGVTINEDADPDVMRDVIATLDRLVPFDGPYRHTEGNSAAHIKASLVGSSQTVLIENGRLALGRWQGVFLCEFDGPRRRRVWVEVVGKE